MVKKQRTNRFQPPQEGRRIVKHKPLPARRGGRITRNEDDTTFGLGESTALRFVNSIPKAKKGGKLLRSNQIGRWAHPKDAMRLLFHSLDVIEASPNYQGKQWPENTPMDKVLVWINQELERAIAQINEPSKKYKSIQQEIIGTADEHHPEIYYNEKGWHRLTFHEKSQQFWIIDMGKVYNQLLEKDPARWKMTFTLVAKICDSLGLAMWHQGYCEYMLGEWLSEYQHEMDEDEYAEMQRRSQEIVSKGNKVLNLGRTSLKALKKQIEQYPWPKGNLVALRYRLWLEQGVKLLEMGRKHPNSLRQYCVVTDTEMNYGSPVAVHDHIRFGWELWDNFNETMRDYYSNNESEFGIAGFRKSISLVDAVQGKDPEPWHPIVDQLLDFMDNGILLFNLTYRNPVDFESYPTKRKKGNGWTGSYYYYALDEKFKKNNGSNKWFNETEQ